MASAKPYSQSIEELGEGGENRPKSAENPVKRTVAGWFRKTSRTTTSKQPDNATTSPLSASFPALTICDGGGATRTGRSKGKTSWSKWKKRLTSLNRRTSEQQSRPAAVNESNGLANRALPPVPSPLPPPSPMLTPPPQALPASDDRDSPVGGGGGAGAGASGAEDGAGEEELGDNPTGPGYLPLIVDFATSIEKVKSVRNDTTTEEQAF